MEFLERCVGQRFFVGSPGWASQSESLSESAAPGEEGSKGGREGACGDKGEELGGCVLPRAKRFEGVPRRARL